jgi:hypothetical protein
VEHSASRREYEPPRTSRPNASIRGILLTVAKAMPTLLGIDHGFSFPLRYFEAHVLKPDWAAFLDNFQRHWPTDLGVESRPR